jgi:hypothetical protein
MTSSAPNLTSSARNLMSSAQASPNPPSSFGCTTSSTPPAPAVASTTPAAPATPGSPPPDSTADDGWHRTGLDQIDRGPYRISKSFVARRHIGVSPVYHCFHRFAFLGTCPTPDDAKALCHQHEAHTHTNTHP